MGRPLIAAGALLIVAGVLLLVFHRIPFIGNLPGDVFIRKGRFSVYIPVTSSIVLSLLVSLLLWLFRSK